MYCLVIQGIDCESMVVKKLISIIRVMKQLIALFRFFENRILLNLLKPENIKVVLVMVKLFNEIKNLFIGMD